MKHFSKNFERERLCDAKIGIITSKKREVDCPKCKELMIEFGIWTKRDQEDAT